MAAENVTKTCSKCASRKSRDEFYRDKQKSDGLTSACKTCVRSQNDSWTAANKEQHEALKRGWRARNADAVAQYHRRYGKENRIRLSLAERITRSRNVATARAKERAEYAHRRESMLAKSNAYRARRKNAYGRFTAQDVRDLFTLQAGLCVYCRADIAAAFEVDHIVSLAKGGANDVSNIQLLCRTCNAKKGALSPGDFIKRIGAEHEFLKRCH